VWVEPRAGNTVVCAASSAHPTLFSRGDEADPAAFGERTTRLARTRSTVVESALTRTTREHELRFKHERLEDFIEVVS
jgi:hypothetical protein